MITDPYTAFKDKEILIAGLGMTGISAASMLLSLGGKVIAIDNNISLNQEEIYKRILDRVSGSREDPGGDLEVLIEKDTNKNISLLKDISLIISSPGIPDNIGLFREARKDGIPVWDELEIAWMFMDDYQRKNTIAVTGTNGKTTVVNLIQKIFFDSDIPSVACGNIGLPLLETLNLSEKGRFFGDKDLRVIEVSSFQLERTKTFQPHIGILLNITSDHMDRHGDIENYGKIKFGLFSNQDNNDIAVLNIDDQFIADNIECLNIDSKGPHIIKFGLQDSGTHGFMYKDEKISYDFHGHKGSLDISGTVLRGMHNLSNIIAAMIPALLNGASTKDIEKTIKNFRQLDHRIEYLGEISGIRCFNDSKSTNPDSTIAALQDFSKEVTLIMGGKDKDMDFKILSESIEAKVKDLVLIGQAAPRIRELFNTKEMNYKIHECSSLEEAVDLSFKITKTGGVLLLSPACASMDMFKNYKERGNIFKKLVMSYRKNDGE